ncbi:MAG: hypothetical protein QM503_04770, partial [Bacteroidota bacterium]
MMRNSTKIYTYFAVVVMAIISFSAIGQNYSQNYDLDHKMYQAEERYMHLHDNFKNQLDPTSLAFSNVNNDRDEVIYLMDTAYVNSNAFNPQRYIHTYSEYGFRVATLIQIQQSDEWVNSALEASTYDEQGNRLTSLWRGWENSNWINSTKVTSTYDDNSNMLSFLRQDWDNGDWVNSDIG